MDKKIHIHFEDIIFLITIFRIYKKFVSKIEIINESKVRIFYYIS